ncbi:hypothetical protein EV401DRAFT_2068159 [Pisolithus croceorrhizus]|nr:hypothetical protein EV401DRAFT_2068159 [Pisolithus croceorrhizus]
MSSNEPPRKRPRSNISPEERKEARAHRNRIAAQNSRDRRKAHFSYLERRVAELEEENHRLRAGLSASPAPSTSSAPDIEYEREHSRRRAEEQRERENQELRERIRTLEKGYEAVVRALAAHGKSLPSTDNPLAPHNSTSSDNAASSSTDSSPAPSVPSLGTSTLLSLHPSLPLSPAPTHSTIGDSPITFASDSLDLPFSPAFSPLPSSSSLLDSPKHPLDLSLTNEAPTRHLARVATTANVPASNQVCANGATEVRALSRSHNEVPFDTNIAQQSEDEATSDAVIARLLAEIIASPPFVASTLPSLGCASEETCSPPMLNASDYVPSSGSPGLGLGSIGIDDIDWAQQVQADTEMEKLLGMFPATQEVDIDLSS